MKVAVDFRASKESQSSFDSYMDTLFRQLVHINRKNTFVQLPISPDCSPTLIRKFWRDQIEVPRIFRHLNADLLHQSTFSAPRFINKPTVTTISNEFETDYYQRWCAYSYRNYAMRLIVLSEYATNYAIKTLRIPQHKITMIYGAVSNAFRPITDTDLLTGIRREYNLGERYIACLATSNDFESLLFFITVFAEIRKKVRARWKLIIIDQSQVNQRQVKFHIDSLGLTNVVLFASGANERERIKLYNAASLVVCPQKNDLTGLSLIEVLNCGVPIVFNPAGSYDEIMGMSGIRLSIDIQAWTQAIVSLLTDAAMRREQSGRSKKQARRFNWQRTVIDTIRVYESAIREFKRRYR